MSQFKPFKKYRISIEGEGQKINFEVGAGRAAIIYRYLEADRTICVNNIINPGSHKSIALIDRITKFLTKPILRV